VPEALVGAKLTEHSRALCSTLLGKSALDIIDPGFRRETRTGDFMKRMNFTVLSLFLLPAVFACAQQPSTNAPQTTASEQQQTITGCLSGYHNRYTIGTSKGDVYLLEGDDATFKKLNGARVAVTGIVSPSKKGRSHQDALDYQFPTLKVASLKKLDSTCGL
jgi:hypothetical protein